MKVAPQKFSRDVKDGGTVREASLPPRNRRFPLDENSNESECEEENGQNRREEVSGSC